MEYFLHSYVNGTPWSATALKTANLLGRGCTCLGWCSSGPRHTYILDCENLLYSQCSGDWTKSQIDDEDLKGELLAHLQSLGKYVTATVVIDYLARPDVKE
ncbi:uncharacterized protein BJ212DRAFT_1258866 [Suillus subaureus]|uniref:Uncharacterized protein n=1 Tax=Suillus subaureus TaxID=48587 RepID=A0A9P7JJK2_9AGAM|nr:uncharacterized protein BJ212DRAFT_1258866 [Suillus subaureus]KAG1826107.1 hypothetical protein BJ212DRAFT_1258866 [Suillus subaureus]